MNKKATYTSSRVAKFGSSSGFPCSKVDIFTLLCNQILVTLRQLLKLPRRKNDSGTKSRWRPISNESIEKYLARTSFGDRGFTRGEIESHYFKPMFLLGSKYSALQAMSMRRIPAWCEFRSRKNLHRSLRHNYWYFHNSWHPCRHCERSEAIQQDQRCILLKPSGLPRRLRLCRASLAAEVLLQWRRIPDSRLSEGQFIPSPSKDGNDEPVFNFSLPHSDRCVTVIKYGNLDN